MVISEARLAGRSKNLIWGIVGASVIVLILPAVASGILLPGLLMTSGIVALTWTIVRMTVSIAMTDEKIVLRLAPFYSTEISILDVVAVSTRRIHPSLTDMASGSWARTREACWREGLRLLWKRRPADGSSQPPIPKRLYQQSRIKLRVSEQVRLLSRPPR